eukprot:COSAG01_NODE_9568_length_2407_cov_1.781196_4_plen_154_part_00
MDEVAAVSQTELARVRRIVARRLEKLRKREEEREWLKRRRAEHSDDSDFEDFQPDFAPSAVKPASTNKAAAAAAKAQPGPTKRPRKVKLKPTAVTSTGRSSRKASPQLPNPSGRASGGASGSASTALRGHLKRTSHSVRPHFYVHNAVALHLV